MASKLSFIWLMFFLVTTSSARYDREEVRDEVGSEESRFDTEAANPLSTADFERAKTIPSSAFAIDDKMLYSSKHFEGDIAEDLTKGDKYDVKNALRSESSKWPSATVPYIISGQYSSSERAIIARAISEYHDKTCVKFRPYRDGDPNYVYIRQGSGCSSRVGMVGGRQEVSLARGCVSVGIVEHELMHALGFVHEQSRTDRDNHVTIRRENIISGLEGNFQKYTASQITDYNVPYDYNSVLHYGTTAFSKNGQPTIVPKRAQEGKNIGQRVGFSQLDLQKINKHYSCGNIKPAPSQPQRLINTTPRSTFNRFSRFRSFRPFEGNGFFGRQQFRFFRDSQY